jgi:hypothetical protein
MSGGQIIGGVVGAVVGFFVGGPGGAVQGAALGAGVGGYLDPPKGPTVQGPRLNDLAVQTSTYGAFIPRVYGTVGIHGNLMWLENNRLRETVRKKKQGGKGGGSSTTVKTYSYSATFHLGLCEGPIAGVRRIWCADKLIYNAGSDDLETIIASNQAAAGFRIYLGTDDQLPDSRYEANVGVGNASAHRGLAYIAFYDFQLADYSNTLQAAQFKVEVVSQAETLVNVLVNIVPNTLTAFGPRSGGALSPGFTGVKFLSRRAVGSADMAEIYLGRQRSIKGPISAIGGSELHFVRSVVSADSNVWWVDKTSDLFGSTRVVRQSDGASFNIYKEAEFQYIRSPDSTYCICLWTSAAVPNLLDGVGRMSLDYGGAFGILIDSLPCPVDYRISTAGDQIHAFRIFGDSLLVNLYNDALEETTSYALILPADQWPQVDTPLSYGVGFSVLSCTLGGVVYLLHHDMSTGMFRVLASRDGSTIENYTFSASGSTQLPYAFHMVNGSQGYILTDRIIQFSSYQSGGRLLSQVVSAEIQGSGLLTALDLDTSGLSREVRGYRVSGGTVRSAIEPLQGAFPFDVISSGYQIKCVPRGQASVATIPWEDMGAADGDSPGDILSQSREMDSQLPARTTIKYLDAEREYAASEQYAERINTEAINRVDRELPLVQTADEAAGVAEVLQNLAWLERTDLAFTLPPTYLQLEPSDVVTVTTSQATYQLRITEPNYTPDGRIECKAKPNRAALYTPNATGGEGVAPVGAVPLAGDSIFMALDIPVVDETLQNDAGFVGVMTGTTASWPGGLLVRSSDDGQTWVDLQGFTGKAAIGTARGALAARDCTMIDQQSLLVDMISGEPESVTRDQMLAGVNYAAYGLDGRWEIVRFQNAALQGDGSYLLSGFVRGEKGTEWATSLHAAGDYFVLLDDPDNAFIGSSVESILAPRLYRGITSGGPLDEAVDVPFTYKGVNLECLSPVYAKGVRDGSSNFAGTFTRRSRLSSSWWATGVDAPLGEATQAYEVDVMNGLTVVRTIPVSAPTFSYSAANQATDFGSPQASIKFRIYQLSAVVGRGYPLEVTL